MSSNTNNNTTPPSNPFADHLLHKAGTQPINIVEDNSLTITSPTHAEVLKAKKQLTPHNITYSIATPDTSRALKSHRQKKNNSSSNNNNNNLHPYQFQQHNNQTNLSPNQKPPADAMLLFLPIVGSSLGKSLQPEPQTEKQSYTNRQRKYSGIGLQNTTGMFSKFSSVWERSVNSNTTNNPSSVDATTAQTKSKTDFLKLKYEAMMRKAFAARMRSHLAQSAIHSSSSYVRSNIIERDSQSQDFVSKTGNQNSQQQPQLASSTTRNTSPLGIFLQKGSGPTSVSPRQGSHRPQLSPSAVRQQKYEILYRKMLESQLLQPPSWFQHEDRLAPLMVQGTTGQSPQDSYISIKLGQQTNIRSIINKNDKIKNEANAKLTTTTSLRNLPAHPAIQSMAYLKQQSKNPSEQRKRQTKASLVPFDFGATMPNLTQRNDTNTKDEKIPNSSRGLSDNLVLAPLPSIHKAPASNEAKKLFRLGVPTNDNQTSQTTSSMSFFDQKKNNSQQVPVESAAMAATQTAFTETTLSMKSTAKPKDVLFNININTNSNTATADTTSQIQLVDYTVNQQQQVRPVVLIPKTDPPRSNNLAGLLVPSNQISGPTSSISISIPPLADSSKIYKNSEPTSKRIIPNNDVLLSSLNEAQSHQPSTTVLQSDSPQLSTNNNNTRIIKERTGPLQQNQLKIQTPSSIIAKPQESVKATVAQEDIDDDDNEMSSPIVNIHHAISTLSASEDSIMKQPKRIPEQSAFAQAFSYSTNKNAIAEESLPSKAFLNTPEKITNPANSDEIVQQLRQSESQKQKSTGSGAKPNEFDQGRESIKEPSLLDSPNQRRTGSQPQPNNPANTSPIPSLFQIPSSTGKSGSHPSVFVFPVSDEPGAFESSPQLSRSNLSSKDNEDEPNYEIVGGDSDQTKPSAAEEDGGEFVMKRAIDFDKLKELRDKTINRLSYTKAAQKSPINSPALPVNAQQPNNNNNKKPQIGNQISPRLKNQGNQLTAQPTTGGQIGSSTDLSKQPKKNQQQAQAPAGNKASSIGAYYKKPGATKTKGGKKGSIASPNGSAQGEEEKPEITEAELQERVIEQQRETDKGIALKLEQAKDKVKAGIKAVIKDTLLKRPSNPSRLYQNGGGDDTTNSNGTYEEQQREVQQFSSAVMGFFSNVIDNLNEKPSSGSAGAAIGPVFIPSPNFTHEFQLRGIPKNFNMNANEQLAKTFETELRKLNLSNEDVERFKYVYEISTKMQVFYSNMIATFGGIGRVQTLVESVVKKVSLHVTMFPINHVYSFDAMHRRILPGICSLLCDDHKLFLRTLRTFLASESDFSFIDFYFIKKEVYSLLSKQNANSISSALALAVMQKVESVRRFIFPIHVLRDNTLRSEVANKLASTEKFMLLFKPNSFKLAQIQAIVHQIFDYFYAEIENIEALDVKKIRSLFEPFLIKKLSRKAIDYIEVFTQQALQEDRFTRNVILRDLHYKFTKLRLKLGFKQGIFGIFTFEQNGELIESVREEVVEQLNNNPSAQAIFTDPSESVKVYDLTFLKSYMRFLLSEYDIFSVYDFSVAMPYLAVSYNIFKFWITCMRTVLVKNYRMQVSQVNIFIRFVEACCPSYE